MKSGRDKQKAVSQEQLDLGVVAGSGKHAPREGGCHSRHNVVVGRYGHSLVALPIPQVHPLVCAYDHHVPLGRVEGTTVDASLGERPYGLGEIRGVPYQHTVLAGCSQDRGLGMPADRLDEPRVPLQALDLLQRVTCE